MGIPSARWCKLALTCALALAPALTRAAPASETAPPTDAPPTDAPPTEIDEADKQAAKQLVRDAGVAFNAGDYSGAIGLYKLAMARRPAPKLHYNIAVCHERLMGEAESTEQETMQADLAIESYNRYLEENPRAADRLDVAERVRSLGGTPATDPGLKELQFETPEADGPGEETATDDTPPQGEEPVPDTSPESSVDGPREPPKHARMTLHLDAGWVPQYANTRVEGALLGAVSGSFGIRAGRRRQLLPGIAFALFSGGGANQQKFALIGLHVGAIFDATHVFGDARRLELGMGLFAGYTYQAAHTRGAEADHPECSQEVNTRIGVRHGFLGAGRLTLAVLLGKRRAGAIDLRVQPGVAAFGHGGTAVGCEFGETPISALGLTDRAVFNLFTGLGYSQRF